MFRIEYKILTEYIEEIEEISDEEIHYNFLLGNVSLLSADAVIQIEWEWLPLLDFAYCLKEIASNITNNEKVKEYFEFTENDETLEFSKEAEQLIIRASFSSLTISTTIDDFVNGVNNFHTSISEFIKESILPKDLPEILRKYLSN